MESRWVKVAGLKMHYLASDTAPPGSPDVVLLPGFVVSCYHAEPLGDSLAGFCRVFSLDLPGTGLSEKPAAPPTLSQLADYAAGWMLAVGLEKACIAANSFACQIIPEMNLHFARMIDRAVLMGPTVDPQRRNAIVQAYLVIVNAVREKSMDPSFFRDYRRAGPVHVINLAKVAFKDRIELKLPAMKMPVLVVRGSRDPVVPQRWAEEVVRLLPDGRLALIPDATHSLPRLAPPPLVDAIRRFLCEGARSGDGDAVTAARSGSTT